VQTVCPCGLHGQERWAGGTPAEGVGAGGLRREQARYLGEPRLASSSSGSVTSVHSVNGVDGLAGAVVAHGLRATGDLAIL
jgi:hypothetical protein